MFSLWKTFPQAVDKVVGWGVFAARIHYMSHCHVFCGLAGFWRGFLVAGYSLYMQNIFFRFMLSLFSSVYPPGCVSVLGSGGVVASKGVFCGDFGVLLGALFLLFVMMSDVGFLGKIFG